MAKEIITPLGTMCNSKLISETSEIAYFWNFPFNIFRSPVTMGS
jgi:hypothetical protein